MNQLLTLLSVLGGTAVYGLVYILTPTLAFAATLIVFSDAILTFDLNILHCILT